MEEKKRQAILNATRKLIETKTPEADIIMSLKELGIEEDDAQQYIEEARNPQKETKVESDKENAASQGSEGKKSGEKQNPFWSGMLSGIGKKPGQEKPQELRAEKKNYMPRLKTSGKGKVTEIIADSAFDTKTKTPKEPGLAQSRLDSITPKKKEKPAKAQEAAARPTGKATRQEENFSGFKTSLDDLEKQLEKTVHPAEKKSSASLPDSLPASLPAFGAVNESEATQKPQPRPE
ncbi:MAG: hypothetical protein NUV67_04810, partial [archaeon]|nr:hypothetical protein [archaeon]